jgi:Chaperone of endosialidase
MVSTYTTNKSIEKPGHGDYSGTWDSPVNSDFDIIDQAFGGTTSLNATAGSATLSTAQYRSLILSITGAIGANVTYTIPSGVGGQWIVYNATTDSSGGPWSVIIASAAGGATVTIPRSSATIIYTSGSGTISVAGVSAGNSSNTQIIYNSSGVLTGSSSLTYNGTTFSAPATAVTGNFTATGNVTAYYSDDRLKVNLGGIDNPLDKVKSLNGFYYEANDTAVGLGYEKGREVGVSAQQVQAILPEIVAPAPISEQYLTVRYERLVPLLIEAIKELSAKVDALGNK